MRPTPTCQTTILGWSTALSQGSARTGRGATGPGTTSTTLPSAATWGLQAEVEGRPWPPAVLFSDLVSGLYAAIMTLAAVAGRSASGKGAYIDLSMTDAALALMGLEVGRAGDPTEDGRSPNVTFIPHYGLFPVRRRTVAQPRHRTRGPFLGPVLRGCRAR